VSAVHPVPHDAARIVDLDAPLSLLNDNDEGDDEHQDEHESDDVLALDGAHPKLRRRLANLVRDAAHDAHEDEQRYAVPDALFGELLA